MNLNNSFVTRIKSVEFINSNLSSVSAASRELGSKSVLNVNVNFEKSRPWVQENKSGHLLRSRSSPVTHTMGTTIAGGDEQRLDPQAFQEVDSAVGLTSPSVVASFSSAQS